MRSDVEPANRQSTSNFSKRDQDEILLTLIYAALVPYLIYCVGSERFEKLLIVEGFAMSDESLDPQAILHALRVTDATVLGPVQGGSDTAIWKIERAGKLYALRVFGRRQQEDCERERHVMQAACDSGLPVPRVHAAGSWQGYPALLLSWLPGKTVAEVVLARPWHAYRLGLVFGHMHAAIHALAAPEILLQESDAWISWPGPGERALQERLKQTAHRADALLHLDYHPFNVLTDGMRITGILDWRNALAGDPRADAARTVAILRVDFGDRGPSTREMLVRRLFERGWRTGYERLAGPPGDLSLFYAWAGSVMERDLAKKRGPKDLARIHNWTTKWKKRAGIHDGL
jgi:aminoglycoside phosphotransferase (APT) family kinase protein